MLFVQKWDNTTQLISQWWQWEPLTQLALQKECWLQCTGTVSAGGHGNWASLQANGQTHPIFCGKACNCLPLPQLFLLLANLISLSQPQVPSGTFQTNHPSWFAGLYLGRALLSSKEPTWARCWRHIQAGLPQTYEYFAWGQPDSFISSPALCRHIWELCSLHAGWRGCLKEMPGKCLSLLSAYGLSSPLSPCLGGRWYSLHEKGFKTWRQLRTHSILSGLIFDDEHCSFDLLSSPAESLEGFQQKRRKNGSKSHSLFPSQTGSLGRVCALLRQSWASSQEMPSLPGLHGGEAPGHSPTGRINAFM